jgi:hypothetical protein
VLQGVRQRPNAYTVLGCATMMMMDAGLFYCPGETSGRDKTQNHLRAPGGCVFVYGVDSTSVANKAPGMAN